MGKKSKRRHPVAAVTSSASDTCAADDRLKIGDRVLLTKLKSKEYNGKVGNVVSLPKLSGDDGRYGIRLDDKAAAIAIRRENIERVKIWKSTENQLEERKNTIDEVVEEAKDSMSADQLGMMRMMTNMFMTDENQSKLFGRKIEPMPNFYQELLEGVGFPHGVNKVWADNYLRTAYEQSNNLPHFFEFHLKMADYEPQPGDVLKRLGTNDKEKMKWYFGPQFPGKVFPRRGNNATSYTSLLRHSFSNQAYRKEVLQQGSTHVAVGFVDLGILFAATLRGEQRDPPLRFLGIEMSSYAVAKTHVIWQMLKQTPNGIDDRDNHLRYTMQAWFSTTLDKGAIAALKSALDALCAPSKLHGQDKQKTYHPDVRHLLVYWHGAVTTTVAEARSQYAMFTSNAQSYIADLKRKQDRMDMAKYEITGDFGLKNDIPYAGNTLMFDCPDGTSPIAKDETVFSAFDWKEIAKLLSAKTSLIDAAEEYALKNLSKLADWALQERVVVELVCAKFEDAVEDIAASKPWSMSWSNVIDYVDHADFHRMARACSVFGDTVHFAYSMNWPLDVFGVNIIDYQGKDKTKLRTQIIETANDAVGKAYKMCGWDKYLRSPPPVSPINTTAHYGLELMHYSTWTRQFFSVAQNDGPCKVGNTEHIIGSPLSPTGASTVAFTWTYDPEIKFNPSF